MTTTPQELVTYLAAQSGMGTAGVNIFYGPMKEFYPDVVILLQEYGGAPDEPDMSDPSSSFGRGIRLEYPRLQVLCRGARDDYDGPRVKAEAVRKAITGIADQMLGSVRYVSVDSLQPPFWLRMDSNFRNEIVFNIQVIKCPSS